MQAKGFRTGKAKEAFLAGRFVGSALPTRLLEVIERAAEVPRPQGGPPEPLEVVHAEFDEAEFLTDRGRRNLPAWRLTGPEIIGCIWVADAALSLGSWPRREQPTAPEGLHGPHLLTDGVTVEDPLGLVVRFVGGPPTLLDYPDAEVLESPAAVTVIPRSRRTEHLRPGALDGPVGVRREIRTQLAAPLGGRVLVNLDGAPCPVTSSP